MNDGIVNANTPQENTFEETFLAANLLDLFHALSLEHKQHLVGVTSNAVLRHLIVQKQHLLIASFLTRKPKDKDELWDRYQLMQNESLLLQDIITFLDTATKALAEEFNLEINTSDTKQEKQQ